MDLIARCVVAVCAAVCVCLLGAPDAFATVTSSSVTVSSPSAAYMVDNQATGQEAITVGGSTNGDSSDHLDIKCFSAGGAQTLATEVPVSADGSFVFSGSMRSISRETCVLRAVPTGDSKNYPPGSAAPFAGPTLGIGQLAETKIAGGPNAGDLEYYDLYASQSRGAFEYATLGGCSISESYTYDPTAFGSKNGALNEALDWCNAWFSSANGAAHPTEGYASPTRSELQVDGLDAYVAGNAWGLNGMSTANNRGFPSLSYSYSVDPASGDLALDETDQVVRCSPGGTFPPIAASCSSFAPTGVQVHMHIVQTQGGRVASVIQSFSSTDGSAHTVDLLENNDFYHRNRDGELDFPWTGTGMAPYTTVGQTLPGPQSAGPGSFFVKGSAGTPDGAEASPQGEVTFSTAPLDETIVGATNGSLNYSWVELHYKLTVPSAGAASLGFTYANAFLAGDTLVDAAAAEAAYRPSLAIVAPRNGIATAQGAATVAGAAADANGLSSVLVNGRAVSIAADGSWSTTAALRPGVNTITAIATNVFGNETVARTTITYTPPPAVARFSQAHRKWREHAHRRGPKLPVGTKFSYMLNEPAQITLLFTKQAAGRRVGRSCVAQTRRNRRHRSCMRTIVVGKRVLAGAAGRNTIPWNGGLGHGHTLAPGPYAVEITAITLDTGLRSKSLQLTFTIVG